MIDMGVLSYNLYDIRGQNLLSLHNDLRHSKLESKLAPRRHVDIKGSDRLVFMTLIKTAYRLYKRGQIICENTYPLFIDFSK